MSEDTAVKMDEMEDEVDDGFIDEDDDDWGDIQWVDDGSENSETDIGDSIESEDSEGEAEETDQSDTDEPEAETKAEEEPVAEAEDADQWLELKHMDETRKVSKDEAKALAQKGMDYDRIREERDSLKNSLPRYQEMEKFLQEMQGDFDSIEEFMDDTRARVMADAEGISYNEALSRVQSNHAPAKAEEKSDNDNINVDGFIKKYPNVKAEEIPESVWADVQTTGDLLVSYDKYDASKKSDRIAELEREIEILKKNQKNKERSTGSSKSSGVSGSKSMIDLLWDDDD